MAKIIKGDSGTLIVLTVVDTNGTAYNISSATTKEMVFTSPVGRVLTRTALFYTDGSDGKIKYTSIKGDFDDVGSWLLQAHIVTSTYDRKSEATNFTVADI